MKFISTCQSVRDFTVLGQLAHNGHNDWTTLTSNLQSFIRERNRQRTKQTMKDTDKEGHRKKLSRNCDAHKRHRASAYGCNAMQGAHTGKVGTEVVTRCDSSR